MLARYILMTQGRPTRELGDLGGRKGALLKCTLW